STEIGTDVQRVESDHPDGLRTAVCEIDLDNQLGDYTQIDEHRRVNVKLGWEMSHEQVLVEPTVSGYVIEPPPLTEEGGDSELSLAVFDPMIRLRDEKSDGRCPVFDGWAVRDVFEWVLDRCGLSRSEQDLEDTGTVLSAGQPESPLWYAEPGRSWLELLEEVARFDYNAGIYFDETGTFVKACRHCRVKRTAADVTEHDGSADGACPTAVDWELYTRGSAATDPAAPGEILRVRRPRKTLSAAREFANYVVISGLGENGLPVAAVASDPASMYDPESDRYVGWRKMHVEVLESYVSQELVNRLCQDRFAELSRRPEHIEIMTPLMPEVKIGHVIEVKGGESVGASDQTYRVSAVRHWLDRSRRDSDAAVTRITARWLGEAL
ncbi:MAG: hypothetical protein U9Q74_14450, partial [Gemmatimonadota bacterium]|nr:hypothetical protein [Gemmatimonadota bacterium]